MVIYKRKEPRPLSTMRNAVLKKVAEGKLNKQISYELGIVEGTVKAHVCQAIRDWCIPRTSRAGLGMYWLATQSPEQQREFLTRFYDPRRVMGAADVAVSGGRTTGSDGGLGS